MFLTGLSLQTVVVVAVTVTLLPTTALQDQQDADGGQVRTQKGPTLSQSRQSAQPAHSDVWELIKARGCPAGLT